MSFIWPWMLPGLLLVPLLAALYVWFMRWRQRSIADLGLLGVVQNQRGAALGRRRHVPVIFFFLGLTLLLIGAARPQMNVSLPRISGTVMLAFDVSASMTADDLEPARMDAAKAAAAA
ncbi:MAG: BatA domain-containing protein [Caldilineaceae bacterium]